VTSRRRLGRSLALPKISRFPKTSFVSLVIFVVKKQIAQKDTKENDFGRAKSLRAGYYYSR
jgi:hypothetical protein